MNCQTRIAWALMALLMLAAAGTAEAAGTLTAVGSMDAPIEIRDHHVSHRLRGGQEDVGDLGRSEGHRQLRLDVSARNGHTAAMETTR